jgi:hypothetical protein
VEHDVPSLDRLEVLRRLTAEERYRASRGMYWTLRRHKAAFLRSLHDDWSEQQIEAEVLRHRPRFRLTTHRSRSRRPVAGSGG